MPLKKILPLISEKTETRGHELCIENKKIDNRKIRPKVCSNTEHSLAPEDILEIDILPILPNSAGYQFIVTMMDVF